MFLLLQSSLLRGISLGGTEGQNCRAKHIVKFLASYLRYDFGPTSAKRGLPGMTTYLIVPLKNSLSSDGHIFADINDEP